MKKYFFILTTIFSVMILFTACGDAVLRPRPRAYPRISFPKPEYIAFDTNYCNFTFSQPKYCKIVQDKSYFGEKPENACWFDIDYPMFQGKVHISYKQIRNETDFRKFIGDAHELTGKHSVKADYIDEINVQNANGVSGVVFNLEGNVASPFQFYLTDSSRNFIRGALYFSTKSNADSLKPVVEFVKNDIMQMVNTFKWKK